MSHRQYGLTFSAPIARDRTFWFGNAERTNQDRTGIITIAPASVDAINSVLDLDVFQVADAVTLQRGGHLLKAGADVMYNRVTIVFPGALPGTYTFTSLADLQHGQWEQFQQAFGEPALSQSNPNLGLFVQDEWRPHTDVTLHAGTRYDLQWLPDPIRLAANNVSPRLGVAWAPGAGRTVVRASAGLYFDRIPLRATSNALQRDGIQYKVAVLSRGQPEAPTFPDQLPTFPPVS